LKKYVYDVTFVFYVTLLITPLDEQNFNDERQI